MAATDGRAAEPAAPRWDPLVRLTHWGVATAVLLNGLVTEGGDRIHVWIGYAAFAMLALRLIWGVVGTESARFSAFPPSLSAARAHIADIVASRRRPHRSHNPLGALMAYALWGALSVVTVTGIAMAGSPFELRVDDDAARQAVMASEAEHDEGEEHEAAEALEEIHEAAANLLLVLAALHVGGVALESRLSGRNLVRPMLKGS